MKKQYKGGDGSSKKAVAYETYGYSLGTDPRSEALKYQTNSDSTQNNLNNTHGGRKKRISNKKKKGGDGSGKKITVPAPSNPGPQVSPQNSTSASIQNNTAYLTNSMNAKNDHYATLNSGGGKKLRKINISRKRSFNRRKKHYKRRRTRRSGVKKKCRGFKGGGTPLWGCLS